MLDLDNTLIDRAGAFREWARKFTAEVRRAGHNAGADASADDEAEWLISADRDGFEPRERLAAAIRERYRLSDRQEADMVAALRDGLVENIRLDPAVPEALDRARDAGWLPVVVTNGTVHQQERKLRLTGLAGHVAGWVISEGAGLRKPDPRMFRLAAAQQHVSLEGAWMIGDSAGADIKGARDTGIRSVWLHRGRAWAEPGFTATLVADTCAEAIGLVLSARSSRRR